MIWFPGEQTAQQVTEPATATAAAMPAMATGCGCNNFARRAKMLQTLVIIAYVLLIIYLFKAITK